MENHAYLIPSLSTQEKAQEIQKQTQEYTSKIMDIIFASFHNEDVTQICQRNNVEWEFVIGENTAYELSCQFNTYNMSLHSHRNSGLQYTSVKIETLDLIKLNEICSVYKSLSENKTAKNALDYLSKSPYARAMKIDELLLDMETDEQL